MTKKHLFAVAFLVVSIFLAYSNSLNGTWAMDDTVLNKPVGIKDIQDLIGFRRVAYITFLLNQSIAPFSPANFRLFNIVIHIVNTVLICLLAHKTMILWLENKRGEVDQHKQLSSSARSRVFAAAFLSAAVFGLHPININAVAYIVQRMASLATLFVLLALLCYIFAAGTKSGSRAAMLYVLSGACVVAGMFSKENAVIAIPLIMLYDYVFLSNFKAGAFKRKMFVFGVIGVIFIGPVAYFLRLDITFVNIAKFFLNIDKPLAGGGWMAVDVYWTPWQHILTEFRVLSRYVLLIVSPLPRLLVFDWWGFPVSQGLFKPVTTFPAVAFILSLFVFSIWKMKRSPMLCFGILWYLLALSLESFLALGSDLYFEHRNYLPVSGLFIGVVGQIVISSGARIRERTIWTTGIVVCLALGLLTFSRNFVWKDSITLWGDTLKKAPSNIRAMVAEGNAYLKLSDLDSAERYFKEAIRISSKDKRARFLDDSAYSLGMIYLFKGELKKAADVISRFEFTVESYRPKILKGFYKALNKDIDGALREYREVLDKTKGIDSVVVLTLMGDSYRAGGMWDKAKESYEIAISLDPSFSSAYYGLGMTSMGRRDIEHAREYFDKALSIDPDNVLALSDKADLLLIGKSKPEDALMYAQRAVAKSPPFYQPYLTTGNILIVLGRDEEAEDFYKKAIERGMADYMVPFSKARAYFLKGDTEKTKYYLSELRKYKNLPDKIKNLLGQKE